MARNRPWQDKATLERLYHDEQMADSEIAEELGCRRSTVSKWMRKHGVERRDLGDAISRGKRRGSPAGFHTDGKGYERATSRLRGENDMVKVHRLVAVAEYGYDAVRGKEVHHKKPIPWLNTPDNLELMDPGEHTSHHKTEYWSNADTPWRDEKTLRDMYERQGMMRAEIADELGCSEWTISNWMSKFGIESRFGPASSH